MTRTVHVDHIAPSEIRDFCTDCATRHPEYSRALEFVGTADTAARRNDLRYDRQTNILRDNRLGELARPSNPSEWSMASHDDAREAICRKIWCDAVRRFNLSAGE